MGAPTPRGGTPTTARSRHVVRPPGDDPRSDGGWVRDDRGLGVGVEHRERERWEQHDREQSREYEGGSGRVVEHLELGAEMRRDHDEGQRCRLQQPRREGPARSEEPPVEERGEAATREQREE